MIYTENHLIQTLHQESEKASRIVRVTDEDLTGWTDNPLPVCKIVKRVKNPHSKSISQKIRSETPAFLSKRLKTTNRQQSLHVSYGAKESDTGFSFKDIERNFLGVQNSMTPKLRNLINSINRAKIIKMNEVVKKNRDNGPLQGSIRIQSISPYRKLATPGIFLTKTTGKDSFPLKKLKTYA